MAPEPHKKILAKHPASSVFVGQVDRMDLLRLRRQSNWTAN